MTTTERKVIQHRFAPRGAARQLFTDKSPEILLSGPAGTGKSRACLEKLNFCALKYAGMRGLIVRKTAVSLTSTALVTYRKQVAREILANRVVHWYGGSAQEPAQFRYSNGSTIAVGGMDKATRIMSSEYDMIFVQEAIELTINDWESLTTRLRNGVMPYQQLIADTNPDSDTHWLNQRSLAGNTLMLESRHEDNPMLVDDHGARTERGADYLAKLDALTGVRKLRLRDGLWVAAEGVVYEGWDRQLHLVDRFDIPHDWPRWWSVDFGYTNPFVLQRWAEDPDGRLYRYAETYHTRRLVEDHARDVLKEVTKARTGEWKEPKPRAIICDHDAEDRATLERHLGMSTIPARKDVGPGIQAVEKRLEVAGDGRPRLLFLRDSVSKRDPALVDAARPASTEEEFPVYVWDSTPGKPPKETPVKDNDHGLDSTRYVVAHRDLQGVPRVRFM
jgi:phage terminase large subunit